MLALILNYPYRANTGRGEKAKRKSVNEKDECQLCIVLPLEGNQRELLSAKSLQNNKDSRILWAKDDLLLTTGFDMVRKSPAQMRTREVKLWDSRKLSSSVSSVSLGTSSGCMEDSHCEACLWLYGCMGMQTSQRCDSVPPHSCRFLGQSHTETPILSLYVCAMLPFVHNHCEGSGNSSRPTDTSPLSSPPVIWAPDLIQSLRLFFQIWLPRTKRERECGRASEKRGMKGWRKKEISGWWEVVPESRAQSLGLIEPNSL
ncbi:hypothetical protein PAMP_009185 [Pampus punctatissimus]